MPPVTQVQRSLPALEDVLPQRRDLFYGGAWHKPFGGYTETINPGTGQSLGKVAEANREDVDAAVKAARVGFEGWRNTKPFEKSAYMRRFADVIRSNAEELALLDAANCGNPVTPMLKDAYDGAQYVDFFCRADH